MPIEFSHPLLCIHLKAGEVVTPLYVAQKPTLDCNERQSVVATYSMAFLNSTGWEA
ncbi:MAG: hypothetical protein ACKOCI_02275 [Cyanobium sp.]